LGIVVITYMFVIEFIILILSSLGLINILVYSLLMEGYRSLIINIFTRFGIGEWGEYLVNCPSCSGVWVGIVLTIIYINGFIIWTLPLSISFLGLLGQLYFFPME